MKAESIEDKIGRLTSMVEDGQQTWDLSSKDVEAIRLALDVLRVVHVADEEHAGDLDVYDVDVGEDENDGDSFETQKMLNVGKHEFYGRTVLECFLKAGESIR